VKRLALMLSLGLTACGSVHQPAATAPGPVLVLDVRPLTASTVQVSVRVDHYDGVLSVPQVAVLADVRCGAEADGGVSYSGELVDEVPAKYGDLVTVWASTAEGKNLAEFACVQYEPQRYDGEAQERVSGTQVKSDSVGGLAHA
jgi:hypothetical protein